MAHVSALVQRTRFASPSPLYPQRTAEGVREGNELSERCEAQIRMNGKEAAAAYEIGFGINSLAWHHGWHGSSERATKIRAEVGWVTDAPAMHRSYMLGNL